MSTCPLQYSIECPGNSPSTDWFCQLLFGCHKAVLRCLTSVHAELCQLSSNSGICGFRCTSIEIAFVSHPKHWFTSAENIVRPARKRSSTSQGAHCQGRGLLCFGFVSDEGSQPPGPRCAQRCAAMGLRAQGFPAGGQSS